MECGVLLEARDFNEESQIEVSSSTETTDIPDIALYSEASWCAASTDTLQPFIQVGFTYI